MTETITKRRVEMTNYRVVEIDGKPAAVEETATDYVKPEELEAYVADAQTRWAKVVVSEEPDAGPAGYHGQTVLLDGTVLEATEPEPKPKRGGGGKTSAFLSTHLALGFLVLSISALIQTATMKNTLASAYAAAAVSVGLASTTPGASAGTEITGGSPAYARITPSWGSPTNGVISTTAMVFNVASGSTVAGFNIYNSGATYLDGAGLTSQAFSSQGTYTLTVTYTQT